MGTGPRARERLRPRADGAPRRRAPLPRRGRARARRARSSRRSPAREATSDDRDAAARGDERAAEQMGRHARHGATCATCSRATSTTRASPRSPSAASPAATARSSARPASAPSVEDVNDLDGRIAERWRSWDSCFSIDYSHIHGGSVRPSPRARYRQWLTHKFGTWLDQFGTLGLRRLRPLHHLVPGRDRRHRGARRDPCHGRGGRSCTRLTSSSRERPVFAGLDRRRTSS